MSLESIKLAGSLAVRELGAKLEKFDAYLEGCFKKVSDAVSGYFAKLKSEDQETQEAVLAAPVANDKKQQSVGFLGKAVKNVEQAFNELLVSDLNFSSRQESLPVPSEKEVQFAAGLQAEQAREEEDPAIKLEGNVITGQIPVSKLSTCQKIQRAIIRKILGISEAQKPEIASKPKAEKIVIPQEFVNIATHQTTVRTLLATQEKDYAIQQPYSLAEASKIFDKAKTVKEFDAQFNVLTHLLLNKGNSFKRVVQLPGVRQEVFHLMTGQLLADINIKYQPKKAEMAANEAYESAQKELREQLSAATQQKNYQGVKRALAGLEARKQRLESLGKSPKGTAHEQAAIRLVDFHEQRQGVAATKLQAAFRGRAQRTVIIATETAKAADAELAKTAAARNALGLLKVAEAHKTFAEAAAKATAEYAARQAELTNPYVGGEG